MRTPPLFTLPSAPLLLAPSEPCLNRVLRPQPVTKTKKEVKKSAVAPMTAVNMFYAFLIGVALIGGLVYKVVSDMGVERLSPPKQQSYRGRGRK